MKKMLIAAVCLMLLSPAHAGASLFGSDGPKDTDEITPLQYASLLGLRDIDPVMFRTKLMPLIDEAMKDGKITVGDIIARAHVGRATFYGRERGPGLLRGREGPAPSGQHLGNDGQGEEGRQGIGVET